MSRNLIPPNIYSNLSMLLLALTIYFGYLLANLRVLMLAVLALSLGAFIYGSVRNHVRLCISGTNVLWLLCLAFTALTTLYSIDFASTSKFALIVFCIVFVKIFYEQITDWQTMLFKLFFCFSLVHVLATFAQFIFPSQINSLNRIILDSGNYAANQTLFLNESYAGITGQTGSDAFYITIFIAFCFEMFLLLPKRKLLYATGFSAGVMALFLTSRRGPLMCNAFVILILLAVSFKKSKKKWAVLFGILTVAGLSYYIFSSTPVTQGIIDKFTRLMASGDLTNNRAYLWQQTLQYFFESPSYGVGFDTMDSVFGTATHNMYLEILAEGGIIGAVLFFSAFLVNSAIAIGKSAVLLKTVPDSKEQVLLLVSIYIQLFFFFIGMFENTLDNMVYFGTYILFSSASLSYSYKHRSLSDEGKKGLRANEDAGT